MREMKVLFAGLALMLAVLITIIIMQGNRIAELEDRVQSVENQHTIVLNSCRTTGQVCREILARLTGGRDVQQK